MNHDRPLFKNNLEARGRRSTGRSTGRALISQARLRLGNRTDQILPPGMPGFKACRRTAVLPAQRHGANVKKAQTLAQGNTR